MANKRQVAFIVLSDGPCEYSTFRPNEDENQWWARRDALVRIVRAACFQSNGPYPNSSLHSLHILFNTDPQKSEKSERQTIDQNPTIGVSSLYPHKVCLPNTIPIEKLIIQAFRSSFQSADRTDVKASYKNYSNMVMQIDSKIFRYIAAASARESNNNTSQQVPSSSSLSKKQMITAMQSDANINFLRENRLLGSIELVLKKVNKEDIEKAYQKYLVHSDNQEANSYSATLESSIYYMIEKIAYPSGKKRKRDSQEDSTNVAHECVLLFLHEDYHEELPIFSDQIDQSIQSYDDNNLPRKVICVLGGVRDIYPVELTLIQKVAHDLHIPVLGVSLGKVAEFTSKIITTMVYHSKTERLFRAVKLLQNTNASVNKDMNSLQSIFHTQPIALQLSSNTIMNTNTIDHLVVLAQLPIVFDDISLLLEQREQYIDLIQLLVATLWRSRIVHHTGLEKGEEGGRQHTTSDLVLLDSQYNLLHLTQSMIIDFIATFHIAAPSEYQVLDLIVKIVTDQADRKKDSTQCFYRSEYSYSQILTNSSQIVAQRLSNLYPALIGERRVYILNAYDITFMGCKSAHPTSEEEIYPINIVKEIYNAKSPQKVSINAHIVVNINANVDSMSLLYYWKYSKNFSDSHNAAMDENKKYLKRRKKLKQHIWDMSLDTALYGSEVWSASSLVTMLQHWSYQGKLASALLRRYCR